MRDTHKKRVQLLVDALRSGQYTKTKGRLRKDDCFCALGVACDIYAKETKSGWWDDRGTFITEDGHHWHTSVPPGIVKWFTGRNGTSSDWFLPSNTSIMEVNDLGSCSFEAIADLLRDEYLGGICESVGS